MKPLLKMEWKAWDFLISIKKTKSDREKDFKNTEIQLVFPASPFFCCHIRWGTQWLFPRGPANTVPLFHQWHSAARRWNPWTHIRDLFLPERAEKQRSISIFIFLHSFYFPQVCILYTWLRLCLVKLWYISFFPPALWDRTYDTKGLGLVWPVSHVWEV